MPTNWTSAKRAGRHVRSPTAFMVGFWALVSSTSAHAYLDPGSGSMILQGLIAALAIAGSGISMFWGKITSVFRKSKPGDTEAKEAKPGEDAAAGSGEK